MRTQSIFILGLIAVLMAGCASSSNPRAVESKDISAPKPPPIPPKPRPVPLDPALRAEARAAQIDAFNSPDDELRANAVESAQDTLGQGAHAIVEAGLRDSSYKVRFSACLAAGMLKMNDLHDAVLGAAFDNDPKVQLAGRFALHRMGDTHLSHDFEKAARDPNPRVREDVAFLLGLLGDKTALKLLNDLRRDDDVFVRATVAEAQWRLGDDAGLELLVGGVSSTNIQLRLLCMIGLAGPKDQRVAGNLQGQLTMDQTNDIPEVALVAARCLGDVGRDDGYQVAMNHIREADPRLRSLTALALGSIGRSDAQDALRPLLKDENPRVRLCAATAILQLKPPG